MLFPQLTRQIMQMAEMRIFQFEKVLTRRMTAIERSIFLEAYKGSRADVFVELKDRSADKKE